MREVTTRPAAVPAETLEYALRGARIQASRWAKSLPVDCGLEVGDLEGIACHAVLRAAQSFDARRGASFATYAWNGVTLAIRAAIRDWSHVPALRQADYALGRRERREPKDRPFLSLEGLYGWERGAWQIGSREACDVERSVVERLDQERYCQRVAQVVRELPEPLCTVVELRYLRGLTTIQAAQHLRTSETWVKGRVRLALPLLRTRLAAAGLAPE